MKTMNGFVAIAFALALASGALACEKKGPLEKAGEKVDAAVDDITHPGEGPVEEAARKTGEAVDEAKEDLAK
jgi:predicted small lipoprotein YifL